MGKYNTCIGAILLAISAGIHLELRPVSTASVCLSLVHNFPFNLAMSAITQRPRARTRPQIRIEFISFQFLECYSIPNNCWIVFCQPFYTSIYLLINTSFGKINWILFRNNLFEINWNNEKSVQTFVETDIIGKNCK